MPGRTSRSGLQTRTTGAVEAATPRLTAAPYPRLAPGATTAIPGASRSAAANDPSVEPLSTTTTSDGPSACRYPTQRASAGPDS